MNIRLSNDSLLYPQTSIQLEKLQFELDVGYQMV